MRSQVPLEHFQLGAILETNDVMIGDRLLDRHRWFRPRRFTSSFCELTQFCMNDLKQAWQIRCADGVITDIRGNDVSGLGQ